MGALMQNPLHLSSIVLLELLRGPSPVMRLVGRVIERTDGKMILNDGPVWSTTQQMLKDGLVESAPAPANTRPSVTPAGRKTPVYYKLTPAGLKRAEEVKAVLQALLAP